MKAKVGFIFFVMKMGAGFCVLMAVQYFYKHCCTVDLTKETTTFFYDLVVIR